MPSQLDDLLGVLHSDEARLNLLNQIYFPGSTEVADRILAMKPDSSVIEEEIEHARDVGDKGRFRTLTRIFIDSLVSSTIHGLGYSDLVRWGDAELADYTIAKLMSIPHLRDEYSGLETIAKIAEAFERKDVAKENLEQLLALQEGRGDKSQAACTLEKLGRYDEAINYYLAEGADRAYGLLQWAMNLAREHSPGRIAEVAQRGFSSFTLQNSGFTEFYVECAQELGKTTEAANTLATYAETAEVGNPPSVYMSRHIGLVKALVSLNQQEAARQLVERVAQQVGTRVGTHASFGNLPCMAQLYYAVGETGAVRDIYSEMIGTKIRGGFSPADVLRDIEEAIRLTGDKETFTSQRFLLHETRGEYAEASRLAAKLNNPELAVRYRAMHELVQVAESSRTVHQMIQSAQSLPVK